MAITPKPLSKCNSATLAALAAVLAIPIVDGMSNKELVEAIGAKSEAEVEKAWDSATLDSAPAAPDADPKPTEQPSDGDGAEVKPVKKAKACQFCKKTPKVHTDGLTCPYCNGTGIEDVDDVPEPEPAPVLGSLAGRPLAGMSLHELRGVAKAFGLSHCEHASVGEIMRELQGQRPDDIQRAIDVAEPAEVDGMWDVSKTAADTVHAVDPDGWWIATVYADGSASVTKCGPPNLHNRTGGASADDEKVTLLSLDDYIERLTALRDAAKASFSGG